MGAGEERALRRRIRSVNSTRKITRAMELIAASRIARAQHAIASARPYVEGMKALLGGLVDNFEARRHPIFAQHETVRNVVVVAIAADRGLCGAYNSNVLRTAERLVNSHRQEHRNVAMVVVGKKAQSYFRYRGFDTADCYVAVTDKPTFADAVRISKRLVEIMESGGVDLLQVVYTKFRSLGSQEVVTEQVYPVLAESHVPEPHDMSVAEQAQAETEHHVGGSGQLTFVDYEFEPEAPQLLDTLVPRVIETRVYGALLDASASEHASRQRAMKAATDNADEFVKVLTRQMNRARQDSITTEIMEIVGGAEALSQTVTSGVAFGRPSSLEERVIGEL